MQSASARRRPDTGSRVVRRINPVKLLRNQMSAILQRAGVTGRHRTAVWLRRDAEMTVRAGLLRIAIGRCDDSLWSEWRERGLGAGNSAYRDTGCNRSVPVTGKVHCREGMPPLAMIWKAERHRATSQPSRSKSGARRPIYPATRPEPFAKPGWRLNPSLSQVRGRSDQKPIKSMLSALRVSLFSPPSGRIMHARSRGGIRVRGDR